MTARTGVVKTDEGLVAAVRAGDDLAFEELYGRYERRIRGYVNGMVRDHARAEDITQDVFVSALRRMRTTDGPLAFKAWLYEIAKNACIDTFRRSKRAEVVSFDAHEEGGERIHLASFGPTPDAQVDTRQKIDHLQGAFVGLSETHHQILVMRELEGRSYREIGERLELSPASVESTLFRARKRLTEEYEEVASGRRCVRVESIIAQGVDGDVGVRDQRRMARHVSYCQPCRRAALAAGFELAPRTSLREKIAVLLPLPAFLRRRIIGQESVGGQGSSSLAKWSATAAQLAAEPSMGGWGKAAAAAVTLAVAGAGAGVVSHVSGADPARVPPAATTAAPARSAAPASHPTTTTASSPSGASASSSSSATRSTSSSKRPAAGSSPSSGAQGSGGNPGSEPVRPTTSSGGGGTTQPAGDAARRTAKTATDAANRTASGATDAVGKTVTGTTDAAGKTVSGTTDSAGKTVGTATDSVGKTVGDTTGSGGKAVGDTTGAAGKAVGDTTGAVGGAVGGPAGDAVGSAGGAVGGAVGSTGDAAGGAVGSAGGAVGGAVGSAGGAVGGAVGSAGGAVGGAVGGVTETSPPPAGAPLGGLGGG